MLNFNGLLVSLAKIRNVQAAALKAGAIYFITTAIVSETINGIQ